MSRYTRTVTTTMNPADTVAAAEAIAANLREQGCTVDVGTVYDNVTVKWYGMPSVDLTVTEPSTDVPTPEVPVVVPEDTPEPMPVAEFGGAITETTSDMPKVTEAAVSVEVTEPPKASSTDSEESPAPQDSSPEPVPSSSPVTAETSPAPSTETSGTWSTTETTPPESAPASTGPDTFTPPSTAHPSSSTSSRVAGKKGGSRGKSKGKRGR